MQSEVHVIEEKTNVLSCQMPLCSFFIERHQLNLFFPRLETNISLADPKTSWFCPTSQFQTSELQILQLVTHSPLRPGLAGCTAAHGRHKSSNILRLGLTVQGPCRCLRQFVLLPLFFRYGTSRSRRRNNEERAGGCPIPPNLCPKTMNARTPIKLYFSRSK